MADLTKSLENQDDVSAIQGIAIKGISRQVTSHVAAHVTEENVDEWLESAQGFFEEKAPQLIGNVLDTIEEIKSLE